MSEVWAPIPDWPGYEASTEGRIRSMKAGEPQIRRTWTPKDQDFYPTVGLWRDRTRKTLKVHWLVLTTFVGPRPDGMVARHLNDIKSDNRLVNLVYGTLSENAQDAIANGRSPGSKLTHCKSGHEFTPENTRPRTSGGRQCRACARRSNAAYRKRARQAAREYRNRDAV